MIVWDGVKLIEIAAGVVIALSISVAVGCCWISMKYDQWKKRRK